MKLNVSSRSSRYKPPKLECRLRAECPISCGWCRTHQPDDECIRLAAGTIEKWKHDTYPPDHQPDFEHWDDVLYRIIDAVRNKKESSPF